MAARSTRLRPFAKATEMTLVLPPAAIAPAAILADVKTITVGREGPLAAAVLDLAASQTVELAAPERTIGAAKSGAALHFEAPASRPDGEGSAVSGFVSQSAASLSGHAAFPGARTKAPPAPGWKSRAKASLPTVLLAVGAALLAWLSPSLGLAPLVLLGMTAGQSASGHPSELAALISAYDEALAKTAKPGQLLTANDLLAVGSLSLHLKSPKTMALLTNELVHRGRLARLTGDDGGRFVFTEVARRSRVENSDPAIDDYN